MAVARILIVGLALVGCSSGQDGGSSTSSLTGTWEIVGSRYSGTPESVLVTVAPDALVVTARRGSLTAVANGDSFDVTYLEASSSPAHFIAQRTPGAGSAGIVPLPLFGDWVANAVGAPGCSVHVKPGTVSATCSSVGRLGWAPQLNGQLTAVRTSSLQSEFGDFGGEWALTTGRGASCTVRFEGKTVTSTCMNAPGANGGASLTLDGNTGHGSTSAGLEFSAQRR